MNELDVVEYRELIKSERKKQFNKPFSIVYKNFCDLGYDSQKPDFFMKNASEYIEKMRDRCWDDYKEIEKEFTSSMLSKIIDDDHLQDMTALEGLSVIAEDYDEHLYHLFLSNTQSRRSRAGKEFEYITELLLMGAGIPFISQAAIGKKLYVEKNLAKLIDMVIPGVGEYDKNKNEAICVSSKTTLRERWQEVPEEIDRTSLSKIYLTTLDMNISDATFDLLHENNVIVVTTKSIKKQYYNGYAEKDRIVTFEDFLKEAKRIARLWPKKRYDKELQERYVSDVKGIMEKYRKAYPYVEKYYKNLLAKFEKNI